MEDILQTVGLTYGEFINIAMIGIAALVGLFILRLIFRMTMTLVRLGCAVIFIGVGILFLLQMLN